MPVVSLGWFMDRVRGAAFLLGSLLVTAATLPGQNTQPAAAAPASPQPASSTNPAPQTKTPAPPIPANAPRMSKQTRFEIIRDFETQIVYARTAFPMGTKGLKLKDGSTTPSGRNCSNCWLYGAPRLRLAIRR